MISNKSNIKSLAIIIIGTSFGVLLIFGNINRVLAEAVPLTTIDTGDKTLDKKISDFYDCIKKAVKSNKHSDLPSYFKSEPTKHQAIVCYHEIFDNNNSDNNNNNNNNNKSQKDHNKSTGEK